MYPLATKLSSHSVTLTWLFTKKFVSRFQSLRKLYHAAKNAAGIELIPLFQAIFNLFPTSQKIGKVPVENLANLFEKHVPNIPELKKFINRVALDVGIDTTVSNMYQALFDRLDLTEDGLVNWVQLERFFFANNKRWNDGVNTTSNGAFFINVSCLKRKPIFHINFSQRQSAWILWKRSLQGQAWRNNLCAGEMRV